VGLDILELLVLDDGRVGAVRGDGVLVDPVDAVDVDRVELGKEGGLVGGGEGVIEGKDVRLVRCLVICAEASEEVSGGGGRRAIGSRCRHGRRVDWGTS
jgi:hypothetical protein